MNSAIHVSRLKRPPGVFPPFATRAARSHCTSVGREISPPLRPTASGRSQAYQLTFSRGELGSSHWAALVRDFKPLPPAFILVAPCVDEGLELGVGDRVSGDLEGGQARVLGILVDEGLRARLTQSMSGRPSARRPTPGRRSSPSRPMARPMAARARAWGTRAGSVMSGIQRAERCASSVAGSAVCRHGARSVRPPPGWPRRSRQSA
jgi:hypothetical protein